MNSYRLASSSSLISFREFQRRDAEAAENRGGLRELDSAVLPARLEEFLVAGRRDLRVSALRTILKKTKTLLSYGSARGRWSVAPVVFSLLCSMPLNAQEGPKGNLIIIGGGSRGPDIMKPFVQLAGGEKSKIVFFPMASEYGDTLAGERIADMKSYGAGTVLHLNITKLQADGDSVLALLDGVTGVYFGGGDQSRLTRALKGTRTEKRLHELYQNGAVLGGTSAGAAVMSSIMLTGDEKRPTRDSSFNKIEAEDIITTEGFGFVDDAIVDQHFLIRRRSNRLVSVVLEHPTRVAIGIDEATAIWIKPDHTFEVLGRSAVIVYDATKAEVKRDETGFGLRAADVRMSVLRRGSIYDLRSKKVIRLSN
ncbi:cyanophycinase [bacterium]|nr:MAG: cyanophycinase [bacterium]